MKNLQRLTESINNSEVACIKKVISDLVNGKPTLEYLTHNGAVGIGGASIIDIEIVNNYLAESDTNVIWVYYMDESDEYFTHERLMSEWENAEWQEE